MRIEQIEEAERLKEAIKNKGVKMSFIAEKLQLSTARLSYILSGRESYVSDEIITKLSNFVAQINTDKIEV